MSTKKKQPQRPIPLGYRLKSGDQTAFAEVVQALEKTDGNAGLTAAELGVDRATIYRVLRDHPVLQRVADDLRGIETSLDVMARLVPPGVYRVKINAKKETAESALRAELARIIAN